MITLTEAAANKVREHARDRGITQYGLRLGVKGGGCSGLSYVIDLEPTSRPGDKVFDSQGVTVFVDPKSYLYLSGTVFDWSDALQGGGFKFQNPNVRKSCGCGESFTV
jgi:iron-sulfur cluster assembly protein